MSEPINHKMSLYVPRVDTYVTENDVKFYFENWQIGKVSHVDFVQKLDQEYKQMYVHFSYWFNIHKNRQLQEELNKENNSVKINYVSFSDEFEEDECTNEEYDFSWFLLKNKTKKFSERKIVIDLEDIYQSSSDTDTTASDNDCPEISYDYVSNDYFMLLAKKNDEMKKELYLLWWGMYDPHCLYMAPSFWYQIINFFNPDDLIDSNYIALLENENMSMHYMIRQVGK